MRVTIFLLFFCVFSTIAGTVNSQNARVSIHKTNVPLEEILNEIEHQTDYLFMYSNNIDVKERTSIRVSEKPVSEVLKKLLGNKIAYEMEGMHIILSDKRENQTAIAQQANKIQEKGNVTDMAGEPVIGASILEKGTTNGIVTDFNGDFSLNVNPGAVLVVSYIGYSAQEVKVIPGKVLKIKIKEDAELLDEVVVVGYGTQKKVNLTGAVETVDADVIENRPIRSATDALQGTVSGLTVTSGTGKPGEFASFKIRGNTSVNSAGALVIIDGMPGDINTVNPQDIETISVLKDAASAAIYGARAAFGVILITTKQGKKDMAPKFNYNNNFSFSKALELPQKAGPLESILAYKEMGWPNDTYVDGKNIPQWETYIRDYMANPSQYPNGYVFDEDGNLFLMRENDMFADMMDNYGFMQNHSFSVSGGSSRTNYRIGLGYTNEGGILITDKDRYERANLSSFLSVEVNKWLTTQLDIRYANSTQNKVEQGGRNGIWGSAMQLPSYQNISPYEEDGIIYPAETSATYIRYGEPRIVKKTDLRALGRIIISPLKNLKITGEYTYNRVTNYNRMYVNQYKYIGMNFTGVLNNTENTRYALTQGFTNYNAINIFANYDFSIGNHHISVMGGFNQEENHAESQWTEKMYC